MLWLRSYRRQTVGKTAQIHRLATLATFKGGPWEQLFLFGVTEGFAFVLRVVTDNDTGAAIVSEITPEKCFPAFATHLRDLESFMTARSVFQTHTYFPIPIGEKRRVRVFA